MRLPRDHRYSFCRSSRWRVGMKTVKSWYKWLLRRFSFNLFVILCRPTECLHSLKGRHSRFPDTMDGPWLSAHRSSLTSSAVFLIMCFLFLMLWMRWVYAHFNRPFSGCFRYQTLSIGPGNRVYVWWFIDGGPPNNHRLSKAFSKYRQIIRRYSRRDYPRLYWFYWCKRRR